MKLFNSAGIVGVGLIGGSIGMAVKRRSLANQVIGICRRKENITQAKNLKAIDEGFLDLAKVKGCDLIILATAVTNIIETIPKLNGLAKEGCIIIDVGSTKTEIIRTANKYLPNNISFIGTHPLAGSEKKGVEFANDDLFENSLCLITPSINASKESLEKIKILWKMLGAKIRLISCAEHDNIIAYTSHLPHVAAFALVDSLPKKAYGFIANSFKDTTRIAQSDPFLWQNIFITNAQKIIKAIDVFQISLDKFKKMLIKKDKNNLSKLIRRIREKRNAL